MSRFCGIKLVGRLAMNDQRGTLAHFDARYTQRTSASAPEINLGMRPFAHEIE